MRLTQLYSVFKNLGNTEFVEINRFFFLQTSGIKLHIFR